MTVTSAPMGTIGLSTLAGRIVPALREATGTLTRLGDASARAQDIDRLWLLSDADLAERGFRRPTLLDQVASHRG